MCKVQVNKLGAGLIPAIQIYRKSLVDLYRLAP